MDEPCRNAPEGRATGMPPLARLKLGNTRAVTTRCLPRTGARWRNFLLGIRRGQPAGAHVRLRCFKHRGILGRSQRVGPPGQPRTGSNQGSSGVRGYSRMSAG